MFKRLDDLINIFASSLFRLYPTTYRFVVTSLPEKGFMGFALYFHDGEEFRPFSEESRYRLEEATSIRYLDTYVTGEELRANLSEILNKVVKALSDYSKPVTAHVDVVFDEIEGDYTKIVVAFYVGEYLKAGEDFELEFPLSPSIFIDENIFTKKLKEGVRYYERES